MSKTLPDASIPEQVQYAADKRSAFARSLRGISRQWGLSFSQAAAMQPAIGLSAD